MNQLLTVELWTDSKGNCPVRDFLVNDVGAKNRKWIKKRIDHLEKFTINQLITLRSDIFEFVKSNHIPHGMKLYELKYPRSRETYRALCKIGPSKLIILVMFKGSGSGGNLGKHLPEAISRARSC